jgi:D-alanyl-D-alanine carboxypeptidase (penicillin-binding protein 5/6)
MSDRAEQPRLHSGGRRLWLRICLGLICACALLGLAATAEAAETPAGPVKPPTLDVTAADLTVASTGQQLYAIDPNSQHAIASTTKLMTALITLQHVKRLNRIFTQMNFVPAPADSQIGLIPGEKMTVHDLLLALLIPSADDAAMDLAYNVGGRSVSRFVAMMNAEARKLGLTHTHYTTPSGLDTPGNHSSAADLSKLADYDMQHLPFFRRAVARQSATLTSGRYVRHIQTTDTLLAQYPWIQGIKTGHTDDAGYVLVSQGQRDGMTLIATVLGTDSEDARNDNAVSLLDYGFADFHPIKPLHRGQVLARLPVAYSDNRAELVAGAGYRSVVPRTDRVSVDLSQPKQLTGPLPKGKVVGHARVYVGTRQVAVVPLLLAHRLPAVSLLTKVTRFLGRSSTLTVFALIAFAVAAGAGARHRRRTRRLVASRSRVRQR